MKNKQNTYFNNNNWIYKNNKKAVKKNFKFKNFIEAFSWMTELAFYSEKYNHHPEWKNIYNNVEVLLTTHDKNSLSKKDFKIAKVMDKIFKKYV